MPLKPLKVTEVNKYIKRILNEDLILRNVSIEGEISNFKHHYSGHMYFSLKDENSRISCVMFKSSNQNIDFKIEDGMNVVIKGYISVYENNGSYQLYATSLKKKGLGELYIKFENLKKMLDKEGLFDKSNKKVIPFFPKKIGVVTSSTGAAIRDIITVINRRMDSVDIYVYPVLVQGPKAHTEICNGLKYFDSKEDIDLIITGRGGGSIEELWAFNEEDVARTIYSLKKPVISAVGHETDFTISDFVSDLRAPTPSAAGELAVPNKSDLEYKLLNIYNQLRDSMEININSKKERLENLKYEGQLMTYPKEIINQNIQKLDYIFKDLVESTNKLIDVKKNKLENNIIKLDTLSPLKTLSRGYSIVKDNSGNLIKSVKQVSYEENINMSFTDGEITAKVVRVIEKTISGGKYEK